MSEDRNGIYAVNSSILWVETIWLVDVENEHDITYLFDVRTIDSEVWYLRLKKDRIQGANTGKAKEILDRFNELAESMAKENDVVWDDDVIDSFRQGLWNLTWLWEQKEAV